MNILLFISLFAFANAGEDETVFQGVSGYAAGQKCAGGLEGGDESASGVRPSQHTVENPGDGWAMAAVSPALFRKLKGCEGMVNGVKVKVMDTCPACSRNGKIDINHSKCSQMNSSNAGRTVVKWTNCQVNVKGRHGKVPKKN